MHFLRCFPAKQRAFTTLLQLKCVLPPTYCSAFDQSFSRSAETSTETMPVSLVKGIEIQLISLRSTYPSIFSNCLSFIVVLCARVCVCVCVCVVCCFSQSVFCHGGFISTALFFLSLLMQSGRAAMSGFANNFGTIWWVYWQLVILMKQPTGRTTIQHMFVL